MHGWGVARGMSHPPHFSRSRLPLMHTYAAITSESSPLPSYTPPLSTPASRSLPLQILLALFTTLVVLSSLLQFTGLHPSLRYVGDNDSNPIVRAASMQLLAVQQPASHATDDLADSVIYQDMLDRLDATAAAAGADSIERADVPFAIAFHGTNVSNGAFVPMTDAADAPTITIDSSDSDARFTFVLVDIDAPDPLSPSHAPFLHYIVANIGKSHSSSRVLVPYFPVSPPLGEHRYVSLLFRQLETSPTTQMPDAFAAATAKLSEHRAKFDVAAFAESHMLVLVHTAHFVSHRDA